MDWHSGFEKSLYLRHFPAFYNTAWGLSASIRVLYRAPPETLETAWFQGFLLSQNGFDPYSDP
jgi:hypothetical protein